MTPLFLIRHSTGALSIDLLREMERFPEQECVIEREWHHLRTPLHYDPPYSPWHTECVATPLPRHHASTEHTRCVTPFKIEPTEDARSRVRTRSHTRELLSAREPPSHPPAVAGLTFAEHWHRRLKDQETQQRLRFLQRAPLRRVLDALQDHQMKPTAFSGKIRPGRLQSRTQWCSAPGQPLRSEIRPCG